MVELEVVAAVVLAALLAVATWMAVVGLMGATGAIMLRRCRNCGHLRAARPNGSACLYCHHPRLARHLMPMRLHHLLSEEMEPMPVHPPVVNPSPRMQVPRIHR